LIGLSYSLVLVSLLRDAPREDETRATGSAQKVGFVDALVSLFSRGSFILVLTYWALLGLVGWALVGWMPTYLSEHFQLRQGVAGLSATGYMQTAAIVGVLIGGAWADRWSRTNERGRVLVPVVGLCVAAPGIFIAAATPLLPLAIMGLILYGLARAFADSNMMPILCLYQTRATAPPATAC